MNKNIDLGYKRSEVISTHTAVGTDVGMRVGIDVGTAVGTDVGMRVGIDVDRKSVV